MNTNGTQQQFVGNEGLENFGSSLPFPLDSKRSLSDKDKEIYHKNNMRLREMEQEIRVFHSYGYACDELLTWLNDDRAYNQMNEAALLGCIHAIHEKYAEHGRWSGMQILRTANEKSAGLSEKARGKWVFIYIVPFAYPWCYGDPYLYFFYSHHQKILL
jgi:hypothetical protein